MQNSLDSLLEEALAGSDATSPQDAVVVALHSTLLAAGFECIAVGDEGFGEKDTTVGEPVSTCAKPQLPPGWNTSQDVCSLQYIHIKTQQRCLVKAIPMGAQLLVSAVVQSCTDSVLSLTLLLSKYVKDTAVYKTPTIYKHLLDLMSILKGDLEVKLIGICEKARGPPMLSSGATLISSGLASSGPTTGDPPMVPPPERQGVRGDDDPLRIGSPVRPEVNDPLRIGQPRRPSGDPDPLGRLGPFGYGDRDRFPGGGIGGGGGGMIFDPFRGGQGGRGEMPGYGPVPSGPYPPGHPPGARFDPVGPLRPSFGPRPGPTRPNPRPPQRPFCGPDPDHLPPPGYDDMFS